MDRYLHQQIKKTVKGILLLPFFLFSFLPVAAQDLMVQVSATRPILPPQVGSYINTPEKFFVVRVTNNSSVTQKLPFEPSIVLELGPAICVASATISSTFFANSSAEIRLYVHTFSSSPMYV